MPRVRIPLAKTKAADMPPVCMVCGGPVDVHVVRTFTWRPPWMKVGFFVSLVGAIPIIAPFLVIGYLSNWQRLMGPLVCVLPVCSAPAILVLMAGFLRTRRAEVECPLCERHRRYWTWRNFFLFAPLLTLVAMVLTLASLLMARLIPGGVFGYMIVGTGILLFIWAISASLMQRMSVRADEITDDDITLTPVHTVFVDLLRGDRQKQKNAADFGWEDYDPYPRRK